MNCLECGRECARYDDRQVSCKNGHVWLLPEFADMPLEPVDLKPGAPTPVRLVPKPRVPVWLPGVAVGSVALAFALLDLIL